eukprot:jgi/Bigna1/140439/aug1.56_g15147
MNVGRSKPEEKAESPAQLRRESFQRDGFVILRALLSDEQDLGPIRKEYTDYISSRTKTLVEEGKLSTDYIERAFDERLACVCREWNEIYMELGLHELYPKSVFNLMTSNHKILSIVDELLAKPEPEDSSSSSSSSSSGDEKRGSLSTYQLAISPIQHLRPKLPTKLTPRQGDPHCVPWHQDVGVCVPESDSTDMITVWIPLVPVGQANGSLLLNPGGHKRGLLQHKIHRGIQIPPTELPRTGLEERLVKIGPGDVLFMSKYCPHRSTKNVSRTVRWSIDLRYQRANTTSGRPFFPTFNIGDRGLVFDEWKKTWQAAKAQYKGQAIHRWTARRKESTKAQKRKEGTEK